MSDTKAKICECGRMYPLDEKSCPDCGKKNASVMDLVPQWLKEQEAEDAIQS
jgi:RNA polymerase subunit RPABC4/transcription elongation factor Spt4